MTKSEVVYTRFIARDVHLCHGIGSRRPRGSFRDEGPSAIGGPDSSTLANVHAPFIAARLYGRINERGDLHEEIYR